MQCCMLWVTLHLSSYWTDTWTQFQKNYFFTVLLCHRLVSTHPDCKLLFEDLSFELENGSIHDSLFITTHAKRLEDVVEAAINKLDDQQILKDYVIELGKLHFTKYGVTHRLTRVKYCNFLLHFIVSVNIIRLVLKTYLNRRSYNNLQYVLYIFYCAFIALHTCKQSIVSWSY